MRQQNCWKGKGDKMNYDENLKELLRLIRDSMVYGDVSVKSTEKKY